MQTKRPDSRRTSEQISRMVYAAMWLAIAMILPFITMQIPEIGQALSPIHIPVFLCGFLCGPSWGLAVGFLAPPLRCIIFGMPAPLYPRAIAIAFECATYGITCGLLYRRFEGSFRNPQRIHLSLVSAMLIGRIVLGLANWLFMGLIGSAFTFEMFLADAFVKAVPGIILHIVLIPVLVMVMEKAGFSAR